MPATTVSKTFLASAGIAALLALAGRPAAAQRQYHITDLGVLTNSNGQAATYSDAYKINNAGQIVGQSTWQYGDVFINEGSLWEGGSLFGLGSNAFGNGINSSGQIAGSTWNASQGVGDAILWQGWSITNLGLLSGDQFAYGMGINDAGEVAGTSVHDSADNTQQAFIYGPSNFFSSSYSLIALGTLGGYASTGYGINNNDVIYGSSYISGNSYYHAFTSMLRGHFFGGGIYYWYDLYDLDPGLGAYTAAYGGNDNDLIVGEEFRSDGSSYPVEYQFDESTNGVDWKAGLGAPYADYPYNSAALAVNKAGQAAGYFWSASREVACLWDWSGAQDLNNDVVANSGWVLQKAEGINDSGQIVGQGYNSSEGFRAFLLTPIGPGTLALKQSSVTGSLKTSATVSLNYPAVFNTTISLSSSNTSVAVPAVQSVTIPAGASSASFTIITSAVSSATPVTIAASGNELSVDATLTVKPVGVQSLALSPDPVVGGNKVAGTITLAAPAAPGSITVSLSSSNTSVALPAVSSITIPAGAKTGSFTVNTSHVPAITKVTIKAAASGTSKSKVLTVDP